jgi:hypothetical protein
MRSACKVISSRSLLRREGESADGAGAQARAALLSRRAHRTAAAVDCRRGPPGKRTEKTTAGEESSMLWLILGIILLAIAIAGGAIVHPVLFVLGILALFMFVTGWRGRTV